MGPHNLAVATTAAPDKDYCNFNVTSWAGSQFDNVNSEKFEYSSHYINTREC